MSIQDGADDKVMEMIRKINRVLTKPEKRKIIFLFFAMLVGSFLELIGISSILPLLQTILNSTAEGTGFYAGFLQIFLPAEKDKQVIVLSAVTILLYCLKNIYLIAMYRYLFRVVYRGNANLSTKMLRVYLHKDYTFHLTKNVSELQKSIRMDVAGFYTVVKDLLQILSELIICLTLFVYLLFLNPWITLFMVVLLLLCTGGFFLFSRKKVKYFGKENNRTQTKMTQWILQSMGGIKEVKVLGKEAYFEKNFEAEADQFAGVNMRHQLYMQIPRPLTETACIGGVLLLVIIATLRGTDLEQMVPMLAVFAVSAFRLLPSVGKVNTYITEMTFHRISLENIYRDLQECEMEMKRETKPQEVSCDFRKEIRIQDISFCYEGREQLIFEKENLRIGCGEAVGLVGPSGQGKTTLADLIMGLLHPTAGTIFVDDRDIAKCLGSWQKKIGYVPQNIYLSDDTIMANVAFGVWEEEIEESKVKRALEQAQILEFVNSLPQGYNTRIGDRGVQLSGGQRQRIGIARALYHNPEFLILDEATSALDQETETAVMDAINYLHGEKTILIIAHRLSTISGCDRVYRVENGHIYPEKTAPEK